MIRDSGGVVAGRVAQRSGAAARGAEDVLRVLELLTHRSTPLPAAMISQLLQLPRSSTYRLLSVLVARGFVAIYEDSGVRRFGLGIATHEIGSAYSRQAPLQLSARPLLIRLVERTTQNGHFAILHGREVLYLLEERAPRRPSLVTDVGVRLPAQLTASGLAMLAALPVKQVGALFSRADDFVERNDLGPRSLSALRRMLVDVRRDGYATEEELITAGLSSVAVAVRDYTGQPVASFALTYPRAEVRNADRAALVSEVRSAADRLSATLGHRA